MKIEPIVPIAAALLLAACAGHKGCAPVAAVTPPVTIERIIYVHDYQPPLRLIERYMHVECKEKILVLHAKSPVIRGLVPVDAAAVHAMAPILAPDHHATPEELGRAVASLDALQNYIASQKH